MLKPQTRFNAQYIAEADRTQDFRFEVSYGPHALKAEVLWFSENCTNVIVSAVRRNRRLALQLLGRDVNDGTMVRAYVMSGDSFQPLADSQCDRCGADVAFGKVYCATCVIDLNIERQQKVERHLAATNAKPAGYLIDPRIGL